MKSRSVIELAQQQSIRVNEIDSNDYKGISCLSRDSTEKAGATLLPQQTNMNTKSMENTHQQTNQKVWHKQRKSFPSHSLKHYDSIKNLRQVKPLTKVNQGSIELPAATSSNSSPKNNLLQCRTSSVLWQQQNARPPVGPSRQEPYQGLPAATKSSSLLLKVGVPYLKEILTSQKSTQQSSNNGPIKGVKRSKHLEKVSSVVQKEPQIV